MKKIVILLAIGLFGWFINLPEDMPKASLERYHNARLLTKHVEVGGACSQDKCLLVYVAPWCPSCKSLTPMINDLISSVSKDGIEATVVIGNDTMRKVLDYSKRYDAPILADANGVFFDQIGAKGVPYFVVTNSAGKRIAEMSGGYHRAEQMRAQLEL
ncbi:MAG: thiol-disulfide isomerase/thioredoxin [Arenicella sp.]|jgi:thiol-disulfide isomerase/thioredoxin